MKNFNLKQLSVDDLLQLREQINDMLKARVGRERRELEARLQRLQQFKTTGQEAQETKNRAVSPKKPAEKKKAKSTKKVAAKYRNPENPSETWSGRGLHPRWLRAAMNGGSKTIEDFRI